MKPLDELAKDYLAADDVKYHTYPCDGSSPMRHAVIAAFETKTCFVWLQIVADNEDRALRLVASSGLKVGVEKAAAMREYTAMLNHRFVLGCFDIDPDNGELRFTIGATFDDMEPSLAAFRRMIATAFGVFGEHFPALAQLLHTGKSPVELAKLDCRAFQESGRSHARAACGQRRRGRLGRTCQPAR